MLYTRNIRFQGNLPEKLTDQDYERHMIKARIEDLGNFLINDLDPLMHAIECEALIERMDEADREDVLLGRG